MLIVLTVFLHIFALYVFKTDLISCGLPFISFFVCGKSQSRARSLKYLLERSMPRYPGQRMFVYILLFIGISKGPHENLPHSLWMSEMIRMSLS